MLKIEECTGDVCTQYGIKFAKCISNTFIIPDMIIDNLIPDCHFIDTDTTSDKKANQQIRFLLLVVFHQCIFNMQS